MHFRASHIPQLASVSYVERLRIMSAAVKAHDRWLPIRIATAFVLMLVAVVGVGLLNRVPDDAGIWVALFAGALFYGYLLWELNGPLQRAVSSYFSRHDLGAD